jgi:predicted CopG family antitoxin
MGTKTVRLDENVYEHIKSKKRDDETFSEAIDRLTSDYTLLDFAAGGSEEEAEQLREAIDRSEERQRQEREELLERFKEIDG